MYVHDDALGKCPRFRSPCKRLVGPSRLVGSCGPSKHTRTLGLGLHFLAPILWQLLYHKPRRALDHASNHGGQVALGPEWRRRLELVDACCRPVSRSMHAEWLSWDTSDFQSISAKRFELKSVSNSMCLEVCIQYCTDDESRLTN